MSRYVLKFSKTGYLKYISHLDMLRLFKRAFKRVGIKLSYSQGFNPHPKMGFGQPLSLGYESNGEILEFETPGALQPEEIIEAMNKIMPEGIHILSCRELAQEGKALAAITEFAVYKIRIPFVGAPAEQINAEDFMNQENIFVPKLNKKKELVDLDIKVMIKELATSMENNQLILYAKLDAGSVSNLSPELLIKGVTNFYQLNYDRAEVDVTRENIIFSKNLQF